ncbi:MAG: WG repeat-containing protein [Cyclobacteriaceae bacterium]
MRIFIYSILLALASLTFAEDFKIFEKDGRYGLKNSEGDVIVPAVHDQLGWSDGSDQVIDGAIGFRRAGYWGLISARNKVLTENKFYSLEPFKQGYLKASIKGKFSNQLFYGLLDTSGMIQISFNYFSLELMGEFLQVSEFDQYKSKIGIIDYENTIIIPLKYQSISIEGSWLITKDFNFKYDVFRNSELVLSELDSVSYRKGLICHKDGYVGFINETDELIHKIEYKKLEFTDSQIRATEYPLWEIHGKQGKVFQKKCDSISLNKKVWLIHMNGSGQILFPFSELKIPVEYELQSSDGKNLIVRHTLSGAWLLLNESGDVIFENPYFIKRSGNHYIAGKPGEWHLYNSFGTKIYKFPLQDVIAGIDDHFIVKRNNYWGVIDFKGDGYISFKYDAIEKGPSDLYSIQFLNKWGIMDKHGNWNVNPEYDSIRIFGNIMVGYKGYGSTYFNKGELLYKNTLEVVRSTENFLIIKNEEGRVGLLNETGSFIADPEFDEVRKLSGYFVLKLEDKAILIDSTGRTIVDGREGYQEFEGVSEGHIAAYRNGRWGFLDNQGRLRIANRYEGVRAFSEGMAAIMLRGKWGFIDRQEVLKVQPYYDFVSNFENGLAIVKLEGRFGLIDTQGKEVVAVKWNTIERTVNGNYLIKNEKGMAGLADHKGNFILRPDFTYLKDSEEWIVVGKSGLMGTLDYSGNQNLQMIYSDIRIEENLLLLKKINSTE